MLGVDPGLTVMGYGLIAGGGANLTLVEAGVIRPRPQDPLEERIGAVFDGVEQIICSVRPAPMVLAVEDLYAHYNHPKTAIIMGHARGAILLAGRRAGLTVATYPATKIKKALTGNGRASKQQIQRMVQVRLGLAEAPDPPDVADALAVAMCHHAYAGETAEDAAPVTMRVAPESP